MRLSNKIGAIAYDTLDAMNCAIASLRERCGEFFFDDVCSDRANPDIVIQATLVYCEPAVNYYQSMRTIDFTRVSPRQAFTHCLTAIFPDYTEEQVEALGRRLKRQF